MPCRTAFNLALTVLLGFGIGVVVPADGQQRQVVNGNPSCPACRLDFSLELTLGDISGPGSFAAWPLNVNRDSRGNYIAIAGRNLPQVFDSVGSYVRTISRIGDGPGEIRTPLRIQVIPGDSIIVMEPRRAHMFGPDGRHVRLLPGVLQIGWVASMGGQQLIMRGGVPTPTGVEFAYHRLSHDGTVLRSFWPKSAGASVSAVASGGRLWTGRSDAYELTLMDSVGRSLRTLAMESPWFRRDRTTLWTDYSQPPPASMGIIREDSAGLLWIFLQVPGPRWREAIPVKLPNGTIDNAQFQFNVLHHTLIEVIDPNAGRVVTSRQFPGYISGIVDNDRVVVAIEDSQYIPRAQIWKLSLMSPR